MSEVDRCAQAGLRGIGELHPGAQGFDLGAQMNVQARTAKRLPSNKPSMRSRVPTPQETNRAPITNSVPATCSPAETAAKCRPLSSRSRVTGARSNSFKLSRRSWRLGDRVAGGDSSFLLERIREIVPPRGISGELLARFPHQVARKALAQRLYTAFPSAVGSHLNFSPSHNLLP